MYGNEEGMGLLVERMKGNMEKRGKMVFELGKEVKNRKLEV